MSTTKKQEIDFADVVCSKTVPNYLGLDIGTNSIGWAVTDKKYEIVKSKQKALWGVHLFDEASSASERRIFRTSRRRRKRSRARIKYLQELFDEAISEIDPGFFQRLRDSFFFREDKTTSQSFSLFNDEAFTDKEYHDKYPTVYHLRQAQIENRVDALKDIRLVYLSIHHILKNRGNFLSGNQKFDLNVSIDQAYDNLVEIYESINAAESRDLESNQDPDVEAGLWPDTDRKTVYEILREKSTRSDKRRKLRGLLLDKSSASAKEICSLLVGLKARTHLIFAYEPDEGHPSYELEFSKDDIETKIAEVEALGEDERELIQAAHNLYAAFQIDALLTRSDGKRYSSLSCARVGIYEKHRSDLRRLKLILKLLDQESRMFPDLKLKRLYGAVFRQINDFNYISYTGHCDPGLLQNSNRSKTKKQIKTIKKCTQDEFLRYLRTIIKNRVDEANYLVNQGEESESLHPELALLTSSAARAQGLELLDELSDESFLPLITSRENGYVPYQLHELELNSILINASAYHHWLNDEVQNQILSLLRFRLPYYIGPLDDRSPYAWVSRRTNQTVRPWNLEEVIDVSATAEKFITRMTSKCSYLHGEDVLPKQSFLYSEYIARNIINAITINGIRIQDANLREAIFQGLLSARRSTVTLSKNRISQILRAHGCIVNPDDIGGFDNVSLGFHLLTAFLVLRIWL